MKDRRLPSYPLEAPRTVVEDGETWKSVPGERGYEASDRGRVRSFRIERSRTGLSEHPRVLQPRPNFAGYLVVKMGQSRSRFVARVVAVTFLGPIPDGLEVCHNNGAKADNRIENLRYGTAAANQADKLQHGTYFAKLDDDKVRYIRGAYIRGTNSERRGNGYLLAAELGISQGHVIRIARGVQGSAVA